MLYILAPKPPSGIMERWSIEVLKIRKHRHKETTLDDLTKYVEDENILMCDPLFSREVLTEYTSKPECPHGSRKKWNN